MESYLGFLKYSNTSNDREFLLGQYSIFDDNVEDIADSFFDSSERISINTAFCESLSNKLKILNEAIDEISNLIELRKALSDIVSERIDSEISGLQLNLQQVAPWQLGHNHSIEVRRLGLEREVLALKKEKRFEKIREWQHLTSLVRLKRKFVMEYQNLLNTKSVLEGTAP